MRVPVRSSLCGKNAQLPLGAIYYRTKNYINSYNDISNDNKKALTV
jgi:hypothetical protein